MYQLSEPTRLTNLSVYDISTVSLVLDLCIEHELWGSTSYPILNSHLHYPTDVDRTLNESPTDKVLQYRTDYNNRPCHSISFMSDIGSTSGYPEASGLHEIFC